METSHNRQKDSLRSSGFHKREWLANITVAAVSILLMLGGIEAVLRIMESRQTPVLDDRPRFYYKPAGNLGMMDREYPHTKPPGSYRIVGIGDSITFGLHLQYDDVYLKRLERMLNLNAKGRRVDVINLAQPGLSTYQQLDDLNEALTYDPDLVILGYCLNDPELKGKRTTHVVRPVGGGRFGEKVFLGWEKGLADAWHTYRFVSLRIHNHRTRYEYTQYFLRLYRDDFKGWKRCRNALEIMDKACRERNVRFAAVIFPLIGTGNGTYPFLDVHEKISDCFKQFGVPCFDLYPAFKGLPSDRIEVLPGFDRHYNEIGQRVAAEAIYQFLVDEGIIPGDLAIPSVSTMRTMKTYKPDYR